MCGSLRIQKNIGSKNFEEPDFIDSLLSYVFLNFVPTEVLRASKTNAYEACGRI